MRLTDLAAVWEIEVGTLSAWSLPLIRQELEEKQGLRLVAEASDQRILGWCACRRIWPEAELLKISVIDREKKRGVGSALLSYLLEELQLKGFASLFLEVRAQNMAALSFYQRRGFQSVGLRQDYYSDPKDSALILRRDIF
jgi:[ribosomal protein S18]-alanine N-acetyltransferase